MSEWKGDIEILEIGEGTVRIRREGEEETVNLTKPHIRKKISQYEFPLKGKATLGIYKVTILTKFTPDADAKQKRREGNIKSKDKVPRSKTRGDRGGSKREEGTKPPEIEEHQYEIKNPQDMKLNLPKIKSLLIPEDTKKILTQRQGDWINRDVFPDNYLLAISKYAFFLKEKKRRKFKYIEMDSKANIIGANLPKKGVFTICRKITERHRKLMSAIGGRCFTGSTEYRLAIGLGAHNVHETGVTLHHVHGHPYIPGSALKGVTRSYVIDTYFEGNECEALKDKGFVQLFGITPEDMMLLCKIKMNDSTAGSVVFFDAHPTNNPTISFDTMTVHYREYYTENAWPTDDSNPTPITFPTVVSTEFQFCLAPNREVEPPRETKIREIRDASTMLDAAEKLLKAALTEHGVGAKTAIGYGRMNIPS